MLCLLNKPVTFQSGPDSQSFAVSAISLGFSIAFVPTSFALSTALDQSLLFYQQYLHRNPSTINKNQAHFLLPLWKPGKTVPCPIPPFSTAFVSEWFKIRSPMLY